MKKIKKKYKKTTKKYLKLHSSAEFCTHFRRLKYLPSLGEFRNSWIYNNLLYAMAGHVAQVKTGQPYENLINNKIIGPLGMRQASCGTMIYPTSSQTNYALPYHLKNGKLEVGDSRIYQ